jgi:hypothetical protein
MNESDPMVASIHDASMKLRDVSEKTFSPVGRFALQKVSNALGDLGNAILQAKDTVSNLVQKIPDMEATVQKYAPKHIQDELRPVFDGIREHFGMKAAESKLDESSATESRGAGNKSDPSPFD